ncbi:MAG: cell division protein FtsL [Gammaproteobacteria bacterium]|nr:cell division protein FtsL [Gammaproteobacteria bacterium]
MRDSMLILVLMGVVLISALSVVYTKHETRKLFSELQQLRRTHDGLSVEYGQLQLEQSTWATPSRVEQAANEKLKMLIPGAGRVAIVRLK